MGNTIKLVSILIAISGLFSNVTAEVTVNLDTSAVPELSAWGQDAKKLVAEWYPRICHLLPTKGVKPTQTMTITLRKSDRGIADTSRDNIRIYSNWIEKHPDDIGLVVHELVHVIQGYRHGGPSWLTEGIADYIRWAIYEGKPQQWFSVTDRPDGYKQSYRVSAGFLLWIEADRAPGIVKKLNTAMRKGLYSDELFEKETGLALGQLWAEYVKERKQLQ